MPRQDVYKSKAWEEIRRYIWIKQHCLCNRCGRPVYIAGISEEIPKGKRIKGIVHHKIHLTESNYQLDSIAYDEANLEGLCIECHNKHHFHNPAIRQDLKFDEMGNLIKEINDKT